MHSVQFSERVQIAAVHSGSENGLIVKKTELKKKIGISKARPAGKVKNFVSLWSTLPLKGKDTTTAIPWYSCVHVFVVHLGE